MRRLLPPALSFPLVLLALGCAGASAAPPITPPLDRGGVSVDLTGLGRTEDTGPDLLRNGDMERVQADGSLAEWERDSYVWLAAVDPERQAAIEQRTRPLMEWEVATQEPFAGGRAARLAIAQPAYSPDDPPGHEFCAMVHQRLVLPPLPRATKYRLSYHQRGHSATGMPNCRAYARITFYDSDDRARAAQTRVYAQVLFQPTDKWREGELVCVAPQSTACLDVRIAITGVGHVEFDDVALRAAKDQDTGLSARLMPWGLVDGLYCLSSGDVLTMVFGFRNGDDRELGQPHLVLELPDFVEVLQTSPAAQLLEHKRLPDGLTQYRYDLAPLKGRIRGSEFAYPYNQWEGLCLFVRTTQSPSSVLHKATCWMEDGQYRSEPLAFRVRIDPPLPAVAGPKLFRTGAHPFLLWGASRPEAVEGFGSTYEKVGFNCVHCSPSAIGDDLGKRGIERFAQPFANGYTMGDPTPGAKPEDAVYRDIDGRPVWEAICPTEVYRRGAYFESAIVGDLLRKLLVTDRRADQLMCNWEPGMYVGRGCYCDRCKAEFAAYGKLAEDEVGAVWPHTVANKHGEALREFRRWQHGQVVATLEKTVRALGQEDRREAHFIPELYYGLLTTQGETLSDSPEFGVAAYLDKLAAVNAWAPYNWYVFGRGPYEYVRGRHLNIHTTATEVREYLQAKLPADRQPRLYAFPYGTYEGVTEPEAIAFEMLTYFVEGYAGAIVYLYPGGYDARPWRAIAEANRQMAAAEGYVRQGRPVRHHTALPVSPLPLPDPRFLQDAGTTANAERWETTPLLQSWEFEREGSRLIAVGNFWERGECFFTLTAEVPEGQYVLSEPLTGRVYGTEVGSTMLTEDDLSQGVLLHVGALRYSWFVLEPYRDAPPEATVIRPAQMQEALQEALPAIERAAEG